MYGRVLSQAGVPSGARFNIDVSTGNQIGGGVVASGSNFFAIWLTLAPDPADSRSEGQFFIATGAPVGVAKTLFTDRPRYREDADCAGSDRPRVQLLLHGSSALPGNHPQDFQLLNTWDADASFKTLTP